MPRPQVVWLLYNSQLSIPLRWNQHTISGMDVASIAWTCLLRSNPKMMLHSAIIIDTMLARTPNILAGDFELSVVGMSPGIAKKETFAAKSTVAWHVLSRMRYASFREWKAYNYDLHLPTWHDFSHEWLEDDLAHDLISEGLVESLEPLQRNVEEEQWYKPP